MKKIAIHSVPRSGSTWLGAIFDSHPNTVYKYQPLFSYRYKSYLTDKSTAEDIDKFYNNLLNTDDSFIDQNEAKNNNLVPVFNKKKSTTIVYKEVRYHNILPNILAQSSDIQVVGIIRNPLAVIHSWYNAPKEFKKDEWDIMNEWKYAENKNQGRPEEFNGFYKWKFVAIMFEELKRKYPERFYLLEYSKLLEEPIDTVKNLFNSLGLDIHKQTIEFIKRSRSKDNINAYSVYKTHSKDNKWIGNLPDQIVQEIQCDLRNTKLAKYLR